MTDQIKKGKVIIAAAGPGDPELITVKAVKFLQAADVVLADRLVSDSILKNYVSSTAEIIYVGKQSGQSASTPQQRINELLVEAAMKGKLVVRLKGGDVSIFSNILDELQILKENEIPYEIVPGVTAALGAAAYAGIPLTARNYANAVRFLTYYKPEIITSEYWRELAFTDDTLVFYMSSEILPQLVRRLIEFGIETDKSIAVIEQATTVWQSVHSCGIYEYESELEGHSFASPTIIIIGRVAALHEEFAWKTNNKESINYFRPVAENDYQVK